MNFTNLLSKLFKSPMGIFISTILAKWTMVFTIGILIVTFWFLKGLHEAGILTAVEQQIKYGFLEIMAVAKYCVPKLKSMNDFIFCLSHTPEFKSDDFFDGGLLKIFNSESVSQIPAIKDSSTYDYEMNPYN